MPAGESSPSSLPKVRQKNQEVRQVRVPAISVSSLLLKAKISSIDFLQVDTEGMDFKIIKWFFQKGVEPSVINFESFHLSREERRESRETLDSRGYFFIETEQDTFAMKESLLI